MKSIKVRTVDKYLYPLRVQIADLIPQNSTVIEVGCANGDLLFKIADKIKFATGIDHSKNLINWAEKERKKNNIKNIKFESKDALAINYSGKQYDYSVACLILHVLQKEEAAQLIRNLLSSSKNVIVCGFSEPQNLKQKILLWLDQRFTNHYSNFKKYAQNGYLISLLKEFPSVNFVEIDTFDPVIKIYKLPVD